MQQVATTIGKIFALVLITAALSTAAMAEKAAMGEGALVSGERVGAADGQAPMTEQLHPAATHHLPPFVTAPGETDPLVDPKEFALPGTIAVLMEPLYAGQLDDLPQGGSCIANAYTNNHEELQDPNIGTGRWLALHAIDTVGLVHAMILRIQVLLPVQTLVLGGH